MNFGKLKNYSVDGHNVVFEYEQQTTKIQVISPEVMRVFAGFEDDGSYSNAIENRDFVLCDFKVDMIRDHVCIETSKMICCVHDNFLVDFYDTNHHPICMDYTGERVMIERVSEEIIEMLENEGHDWFEIEGNRKVQVVKKLNGDECFYGLGDKTGFLDKRGYDYMMWNTDNPEPQVDSFKALYKSIPFFMTLSGGYTYGIFFDTPYKSWFDMGKESKDYFWFGADEGNLDYYFMLGKDMAEVIKLYTNLTGTCPLPQKWTLGYQQSRWGYVNWGEVKDVAQKMRANDIPCDVIHLDIDYMQDYKVFTWNQDRYEHDPKNCVKQLKDMGIKVVTIIDPGVKVEKGYEIYEKGMANDYFAKNANGDVYVNAVWPGDAVFPDFGKTKVRSWWANNQKFLINMGVRGVWNDMNEPASFNGPLPDDVVFSENDKPVLHKKAHNVYGHQMAKATYEGLKAYDGRRPFVITRACYAGSQKYSTVWTGDNQSLWTHLQMVIPQLCNLGLSGIAFAGTDIGGFGADTTPELLARWIQVGCFSPLCRNHSSAGTRRQEPWVFGNEIMSIYRKYVKLRYHFIPYIYDLFHEQEANGMPIMRPLVLMYPEDKEVRDMNDEFMVGPNFLVAPVVTQGTTKRLVYLPEGEWYDYWTKERFAGGQWIIKEAPLDVCPIYVKAGAVIPVMEDCDYIPEKTADTLQLEVYDGIGKWTTYLDNGTDFDYREGKCNQYDITQTANGDIEVQFAGGSYEHPYKRVIVRRMDGSEKTIEL